MRALQEVLNAGLKMVKFLAQVQNCSERANNEKSQGEDGQGILVTPRQTLWSSSYPTHLHTHIHTCTRTLTHTRTSANRHMHDTALGWRSEGNFWKLLLSFYQEVQGLNFRLMGQVLLLPAGMSSLPVHTELGETHLEVIQE